MTFPAVFEISLIYFNIKFQLKYLLDFVKIVTIYHSDNYTFYQMFSAQQQVLRNRQRMSALTVLQWVKTFKTKKNIRLYEFLYCKNFNLLGRG